MDASTRFATLSALATGKQASPIGLFPVHRVLSFALITATQLQRCPKTAVADADTRAAGVGRVRPGCAVDVEGEKHWRLQS